MRQRGNHNSGVTTNTRRWILVFIGLCTALAGLLSLFFYQITIAKVESSITLVGGVAIAVAAVVFDIRISSYIFCIALSLLSSGATTEQQLGLGLLAYALAIAMSGALIDQQAIILITLLSGVGYIVGTFLNPNPDFNSMVIVLLLFVGLAVPAWLLTSSQGRAIAEASARTLELEAALSQLRSKQSAERQTGTTVVQAISHLRGIATEQSSSVQEQAASLAEVTSTVAELSQTALQIAEAATEVDQLAEQALNAVNASQEAVNASLQAMVVIRIQVQQIVERTVALNERIQGISDVVLVVSNIAAQTHLLALNAAIEAAGAGAEGERFSTVAAEVKKLAQQSQEEAGKIRRLVAEIQAANAASVMATEQGLKESAKGAAQARAAADANLEVIDLVSATSMRTKAITMATQQQRSASQQMVDTMHQLQMAAQGLAKSATSITDTVDGLSGLATLLGAMMGERTQAAPPHDEAGSRPPKLPNQPAPMPTRGADKLDNPTHA